MQNKHLIESPDHEDFPDLFIAIPNAQRFIMCDGSFSKLQQGADDGGINKCNIGHFNMYFLYAIHAERLVNGIAQIPLG